jgi:hypothetical protein
MNLRTCNSESNVLVVFMACFRLFVCWNDSILLEFLPACQALFIRPSTLDRVHPTL